jgi:phage terminase large subunit GpA-like protein
VRTEERILKLKDDRPAGLVPGGGAVACLMAGVDTQDNGFWYEIRAFGWGFAGDSWAIRSGFIIDFEALQKVLWEDVYKDAAGLTYPVQLVCQDAMGHRTADVYDFCRINRGAIFPCMGKDRQTQPFAYSNIDVYPGTKKQIPGGIILVRWDTNYFKNKLSSMLEVSPGDPGCWNYNQDLTDEWARQMTVEGINPDTGLWENPQEKPNHAWDCSALVLLAADIVGVRFWQRPAPAGEPEKKASAPARAGMW